MRHRLIVLLATSLFMLAAAAPASAGDSPGGRGWSHTHWVPTDMGEGAQCGVPFVSMQPTGFVDFWMGPIDARGRQEAVQHWKGSMTFTGPEGSTVTLREDDWRFIHRAYTSADRSTYDETTVFTGLLEQLMSSDGARRLTDSGVLTTKTTNADLGGGWYVITRLDVTGAAGLLPMRRSGFDLELQGWNRECAFFADHLR